MRSMGNDGDVRSVNVVLAVLALVILVVGVLYFIPREDTEAAAETVSIELDRAAEALRETSEDVATTTKVKTALGISKSVQAFDIDVDSRDGTVTLTGTVPSAEAEAAALQIARDTSGVNDVIDQIRIEGEPELGGDGEALRGHLVDAELKALVLQSLLRAAELNAEGIDVVVEERVVTLTGTVSTESEKERAASLAGSVSGVRSVVNTLAVQELRPLARGQS